MADPPETSRALVLFVAAIGTSAFGSLFAAGDAALTALPEARLQELVAKGDAEGRPFTRYHGDRLGVLSRWLVCRVIALAIAAALSARAAETFASTMLATLAIAPIGAVIGYGTWTEILSTLARRRPEPMGRLALRFLRPFEYAVYPLAEPLAAVGRFVGRTFAPRQPLDARATETQVEWVVSEGERTGALANEPAEMIRNVLEFKDLTARDVMVPRRHISAVDAATPLQEVLAALTSDKHSRYPVFRETLDNVIGLLYAKDLFEVVQREGFATTKLDAIVRTPVLFVVETQPILSILREMRARRLHMAIVSDEFGGTSGLVTLEDIIEEIVGEINDEHDTDADSGIEDLGEGRVVADASIPLNDLSARLGINLRADGDFESLGGLIVHRAGKVPAVGTTLKLDGVELIVREADETRVVKVEIIKAKDPKQEAAAP